MYYIIYKTINLINNKEYTGKHQTKKLEDNYLGSGKHLKYAIRKYGHKNFKKEILFVFDNEQDMNDKEAELVTEEYCDREDTYNICSGGHGGWGYVNRKVLTVEQRKNNGYKTIEIRKKLGIEKENVIKLNNAMKNNSFLKEKRKNTLKEKYGSFGVKSFLGRTHTEETKRKMAIKAKENSKGSKNSQFGTCWITKGNENKKIKKEELDFYLNQGYIKGRYLSRVGVAVKHTRLSSVENIGLNPIREANSIQCT
jgi:hypothetical protein